MKKEVSIFWLRRDLRLHDNNALYHALKGNYQVLPIFIFDKHILKNLTERRDRRVAYIHKVLEHINAELKKEGSSVYVLHDFPYTAFEKLCDEYEIKEVYANHDYEPYSLNRDAGIKEFLSGKKIPFHTYKDQVIFEKSEIVKPDGSPYIIFTPYSMAWLAKLKSQKIPRFPSEKGLSRLLRTNPFSLPSMKELGFEEVEALDSPVSVNEEKIRRYSENRNLPEINGTTQLSTALRFGTVSIRKCIQVADRLNDQWLRQLIWREFFMMILFHFPYVVENSFKKKYDLIEWRNNEQEFELWCKGATGYPMVDAGMRQLNETGWMHNRVRMIVASFLTRHLLIDWRWGEAYFSEKLLDYELSSNNGNWQWVAGSGCDSTPYFRIFNPLLQLKRFDPDLNYVKKWIANFRPGYLDPIVAHEYARKRAIEVYKRALD